MLALLDEFKGFVPLPLDGMLPPLSEVVGGIRSGAWIRGLHIHSGADLRKANLRGADLRRMDLTEVRFEGADLTGAKLGGALMTGAKLAGAKLFNADIAGAIDLDLTGARVHPFFESSEGEAIGHYKLLNLAEFGLESHGRPHHLTTGPDGRLFWLEGFQPAIQSMTATGARHTLPGPPDWRLLAMSKDSKDNLWLVSSRGLTCFGMGQITAARMNGLIGGKVFGFPFTKAPNLVAAGSDGAMWMSRSDGAIRFEFNARAGSLAETPYFYVHKAMTANCMVVPNREGSGICYAAPDMPAIFVLLRRERSLVTLNLPPGSRLQRIVQGLDNRMWFTLAGTGAIGEIRADGKDCRIHPLARPGEPRLDPFGIVAVRDGSICFSLKDDNSIGRMTPEGVVTVFRLAPGTRPHELLAHGDQVFFTVEGKDQLGCIRSELRAPAWPEPGAEDLPAAADGWECAEYRPRPARPKALTDEQRRAAHGRRMELAQQLLEARLAEEEAGSDEEADLQPDPLPVVKAAAAVADLAPTPLGPGERLAALGVLLTSGRAGHALEEHKQPKGNKRWKGAWVPVLQRPGAMEELIAEGMETSGAIAKGIAPDGAFETRCESPRQVGWYTDRSGRHPTRCFRVITERHILEDEEVQVVMTAYPIAPHW